MRLIKLAFISFVVLGLLITTISLLMPSTILVAKSININAPKDSVYACIADLRKWEKWCANMQGATIIYGTKAIGKHAVVKVNKTTIRIDSVTSESIATTWQTAGSSLEGSFNFLPDNNSSVTSLQWQFIEHVKWYPWEKFAAIFSDKAMSGFMENSLDKMKATIESESASH